MTEEWILKGILLAKDLESFMYELGYPLFLGYGTLLGAVREGKTINGDDDLDFFTIAKHSDKERVIKEVKKVAWALKGEKLLSKIFVKGGWKWENELQSIYDIENPTGQIHVKGRGVTIDLWFDLIDNKDNYINGCFGNFGDSNQYLDGIKHINFEGQNFAILNNSEKMLSLIYGDDWRTPRHGEKRGKGLSKRKDYLL